MLRPLTVTPRNVIAVRTLISDMPIDLALRSPHWSDDATPRTDCPTLFGITCGMDHGYTYKRSGEETISRIGF